MILSQAGASAAGACTSRMASPMYTYNFLGAQAVHDRGGLDHPRRPPQLRMEFAYDGGGLGKGGTVTLYVDGEHRRRRSRRRGRAADLLRRRNRRRRLRHRLAGHARLHPRQQPLHRHHQMGPDRRRRRRRRRRPHDHPRSAFSSRWHGSKPGGTRLHTLKRRLRAGTAARRHRRKRRRSANLVRLDGGVFTIGSGTSSPTWLSPVSGSLGAANGVGSPDPDGVTCET